jgi:HEAT repeat protein
MTTVLAALVGWFCAATCLLTGLIVAIRVGLRSRRRRLNALRPGAEASIAGYLAGGPAPPEVANRRDRAIVLAVAVEALADLRGRERDRLTDYLCAAGYVADVIDQLTARRTVRRRRAADILATIATPATAAALTAGLGDRDILVRTTCAATLAEVGGENVVPAVVSVAGGDAAAAPGAAASIVLALGLNRPSALTPLLGPAAVPEVRAAAIAVASELRLSQHAPLLQDCLSAADDLAAVAARGLGMIGEVQAVPALAVLAADDRRAMTARAAATLALGRIGDVAALPAIERQLVVQDWRVRASAAEALSMLGTPGDAALHRAAGSESAEVRVLAEARLAQ